MVEPWSNPGHANSDGPSSCCCTRGPARDDPLYYYRPWKTILIRTVADGGQSYYFRGDHRQTIPTLLQELVFKAASVVWEDACCVVPVQPDGQ